MKILWVFFLLAEISGPKMPLEPVVPSPEIDEVRWPEKELTRWDIPTNTFPEMHLFRVEVSLYGVTNRYEGLWKLAGSPKVVLTNTSQNSVQIVAFSLYDIARIDILSWRISTISNTWHEFIPHEIRCLTWDQKTNQGYGDLSWLKTIVLEMDNIRWTGYTMFYDSWEKGAGDRLRWRHAQFPHFPYHFTTPVVGTITSIRFFYP